MPSPPDVQPCAPGTPPGDATLRRAVERVVSGAGCDGEARQRWIEEMESHLGDALDRELANGTPEPQARARVLADFGDPARIARELFWRQLLADLRRAMRFSPLAGGLVAADLGAAVVWSGVEVSAPDVGWVSSLYQMMLLALLVTVEYWAALVAFRAAWALALRAWRAGLGFLGGSAAAGLGLFGAGILFYLRPSAVSMIACGVEIRETECGGSWPTAALGGLILAVVAGIALLTARRGVRSFRDGQLAP